MTRPNPPFMSGVPELMILNLLKEREMYGYQIVQAIRLRTSDAVNLAEGVVYPVLHGLKRAGALKASRKTVEGRSRVYYTLTTKGALRLDDLKQTWSTLAGAVQAVSGGKP